MTGEYYAELENNHHYIIVDGEHDRTYYCPAQDDANALAHLINDKNKTIANLMSNQQVKPIYEIQRNFEDRISSHVAFVNDEKFAIEFCEEHSDCTYHQIHVTKYPLELETLRTRVPTCENCKHLSESLKGKPICRLLNDFTTNDNYCEKWDMEL